MKLSKREIVLLMILIIIGLFFIEYQFVVTPGLKHYNELSAKQIELDKQIDEINLNLKMAETFAKLRDQNLLKIATLSAPFINGLKSDALMLFTHNLMQRNGFLPSSYTLSMLKSAVLAPKEVDLRELTYQLGQIADQYKGIAPKTTPKTVASGDSKDSDAVEQLTIQIKATSNYAQLLKLMDDLKALNRSITISNLKISAANNGLLDVDISLFFVGIKSLVPREDDLTKWNRAAFQGGVTDPYKLG